MENFKQWWKNSKYGMFIHFGLYSATEGYWQGEEVPFIGEWIQFRKQIPISEYKTLANTLNLDGFNAKEYVSLAKSASMKYIVITAKHHDGFAMYNSQVSDYNITKMCKGRRDPLKELSDECHKHGIKFCVYYSHALDWEDKDATGNDWDYNINTKNFAEYLERKCKPQLRELLTNYGEVGIVWFDVPRGISHEQSDELYAFVKSIQPNCICSGRLYDVGNFSDYISAGDNVVPYGKMQGDNETAATHNNTWGYKRNDFIFKPASELCQILAELISKNTNYLLNVGPKGDGSIPLENIIEMSKAGEWIHANAKAIYGTNASPFDYEIPNLRFTYKGNRLFMFILKSAKIFEFNGLISKVNSVNLIGGAQLAFTQNSNAIKIMSDSDLPKLSVVEIITDGDIDVKTGIYPAQDGNIYLPSCRAKIKTGTNDEKLSAAKLSNAQDAEQNIADKIRISDEGLIINWYNTAHTAIWDFEANSGEYEAYIITQAKKYCEWQGEHKVKLLFANGEINSTLKAIEPSPFKHWNTNGLDITKVDYKGDLLKGANRRYYDERLTKIGNITLNTGVNNISLKADYINPAEEKGLSVIGLQLKPVK